jgi:hypothetical protein
MFRQWLVNTFNLPNGLLGRKMFLGFRLHHIMRTLEIVVAVLTIGYKAEPF